MFGRERKGRNPTDLESFRVMAKCPIGMLIVDQADHVRFVNQAAQTILGIKESQILGRPIGFAFRRGGTSEIASRRPDGEKLILEVTVTEVVWEVEQANLVIIHDVTARRESEVELRKLYRAVMDSPIMAVIMDKEGNIESINPKFTEITGFGYNDIAGRNLCYLASTEAPNRAYSEMWKAVTTTGEWHGEVMNRRKNGAPYWERLHISAVKDLSGAVTNLIAFKEDVTVLRRLEEEHLLLASIVDSSSDAIIAKTLDGIITSWNKSAEKMYGYTAWEAIGQPVTILAPPDRAEEITHILEKIRQGERIEQLETVRVTRQGEEIFVSLTISPIIYEGKVIGASTIARDITGLKQAELALRQSERRLTSFLFNLPAAAWMKDMQGRYVYANAEAEQMFSLPLQEFIEKSDEQIFPPETARLFVEHDLQVLDGGDGNRAREIQLQNNGIERHAMVRRFAITDDDGRPAYIAGVAFDVTEQIRSKDMLQAAKERLSYILGSITDAYMLLDSHWRFVELNPFAERVFNRKAAELVGKVVWEEFPQSVHSEFYRQYHQAMAENVPVHFEAKSTVSNRWYEVHAYPRDGKLEIYFRDITQHMEMEEAIRHQAHHDWLTDLPNRQLFLDILTLELTQARRNQTKLALLFLDLDGFKTINDTLGHDQGDELLKQVAARIRRCVRKSDTVARIGGDEFNILMPDLAQTEDAHVVVRKILRVMERPFVLAGHEIRTTASIGISVCPEDGENIDELMKKSDIAMYHAKGQGRNAYQFYNNEINVSALRRLKMETQLHQAIEKGELELAFQPQIEIHSNRIRSVEALLRWRHPEEGILLPGQFLDIAEESGIIIQLGEWVLRTACNQMKRWLESGNNFTVTVNISKRQFHHPKFIKMVGSVLGGSGLDPSLLELEITENTITHDMDVATLTIQELTRLGVRVSIDHFGSGCSSLQWIRKLPIQKVKIEREFIRDISVDADEMAVVNAVIAVAHTLKLTVTAEGVETEEQLAALEENGCDQVQGYLLCRPVAAADFSKLAANM